MEDEYEIMPHHEIEKLKDEIDALRKSPSYKSGVSLQDSIENLSKQLKHMQNILEYASNDLNSSESSDPLIHKLANIEKKMDTIMDQNEKVAKSVLILVDLIREKELKNSGEEKNQAQGNKPSNKNSENNNYQLKPQNQQASQSQQNPVRYGQNYQMPNAQFPDFNSRANVQSNSQNPMVQQKKADSFNMQSPQRQEVFPAQKYSIPGPSSDFSDNQSFNPQVQSLMQNNKVQPQQNINNFNQPMSSQSQNWNNMDLPPMPPGSNPQAKASSPGLFPLSPNQAQNMQNVQKAPEKKGFFSFIK